jgi:uncharacterized protein (UPF0335 family)
MARDGGNMLSDTAAPFLASIERIDDELLTMQGEYMKACAVKRLAIKGVYTEAKDRGVNPRALKGVVKTRKLQKKIDDIPDDFDIDETAAFRELVEALGPLGAAAAQRAGYASPDDGKDLRPHVLKEKEEDRLAAQREQEQADRLAKEQADRQAQLGRGPVEAQHPVDALAQS